MRSGGFIPLTTNSLNIYRTVGLAKRPRRADHGNEQVLTLKLLPVRGEAHSR